VDTKVPIPQGAYNSADYANLNVASDIKELFKYIDRYLIPLQLRYKAPSMELEAKLKPFIPEYIPAIGEVDAFLKMPRPDG
jgi:intraflagellar transport protein 46